MSDVDRPTDEEIEEEGDAASDDTNNGVNKYPGMSYADGVDATIRWVLGNSNDKPYTED